MFNKILKKVLMILPLSLIHISILYVRVVEFLTSKNISNSYFSRILNFIENTILCSEECKTVFVEVYDNFEKQATNVSSILSRNGFKLMSKEQSDLFKGKRNATFNQIWLKS
jgi:hypothetical protein